MWGLEVGEGFSGHGGGLKEQCVMRGKQMRKRDFNKYCCGLLYSFKMPFKMQANKITYIILTVLFWFMAGFPRW